MTEVDRNKLYPEGLTLEDRVQKIEGQIKTINSTLNDLYRTITSLINMFDKVQWK